jgi:HEAT repeat protein
MQRAAQRGMAGTYLHSMKLERYKEHGVAHIRQLERDRDVAGLLAALESERVSRSTWLTTATIEALRSVGGSDAAQAVSALLAPDRPDAVRRSAARMLGSLGDMAGLTPLRAALNDPSKQVQMWAMRSLGELRDRECLDVLIGNLQDDDSGMRTYAAGALGQIGDQRATEPLIAVLRDPQRTVCLSVIRALVELRDPRAVDALRLASEETSALRRRPYSDGLRNLEELLP